MFGIRVRIAGAMFAVVAAATAMPGATGAGARGLDAVGRYEGTATVVVTESASGAVGVATADVVVSIGPALDGESNPFHLAVTPGEAGEGPGAVTIESAGAGADGAGPTVQHWAYRAGAADVATVAFTGQLVDNSPVVGVVPNRVAVTDASGAVVPLALDAGVRMTGRADDAGMELTLDGTAGGGSHAVQILVGARAVAGATSPAASPAGQPGTINMDSVLLLARPELVSPTVAVLSYGTVVTITGPSVSVPYVGSYLPVTLTDGTDGWVYEPFVDRVGEPAAPATGDAGIISLGGVLLRDEPSFLGGVVATLPASTPVTITGAAVHDFIGGIDYLPVTLDDGTTGWVVEAFVVRA